jgi:hypothetical protein
MTTASRTADIEFAPNEEGFKTDTAEIALTKLIHAAEVDLTAYNTRLVSFSIPLSGLCEFSGISGC